ncbi:unnamed protein product [Aphanomyces euteiches]|nr:hypothetical protein AeRB84_020099 [Aphanomyces euteiches]
MGTALSTFDKWCKNGETINHMQDTTKKHLVLRPKKRPKYDKHKRPSDEREAILYDWLQQAPKPIDHKAMRAKALELWPEYRDETHSKCKTPGNFRKYCLRFAQRYLPSANSSSEDSGNHDTTSVELLQDCTSDDSVDPRSTQAAADRAAAEAAARQATVDLAAAQMATEQAAIDRAAAKAAAAQAAADREAAEKLATERAEANRLTLARLEAERHAAERRAAEHIAAERDAAQRVATGRATAGLKASLANKLAPTSTQVPIIDLSNQGSPTVRRANTRKTSNMYPAANPDDLASHYDHILENKFPKTLSSAALPRRLAKVSLGVKNKRGVYNDHCSRCSARSPCVNFNICENIQSKAECASNRCMAGKFCKNNAIQNHRFPPTTVVIDPVLSFSLR